MTKLVIAWVLVVMAGDVWMYAGGRKSGNQYVWPCVAGFLSITALVLAAAWGMENS